MKLAFYINYLNHHQVALTDALYDKLGHDFVCVCTRPVKTSELKGGADFSDRVYCINATDSKDSYNSAMIYARESEVCIFGADSLMFAIERAKNNLTGISFEVGERWFKKGYVNALSPRFLRWLFIYYKYFRKSNFYRLCAGAFVSKDLNFVGAYKNKCFKWGYFTKIDNSDSYIQSQPHLVQDEIFRIMWCSRFLRWKHPELPVKLAVRLKKKGFRFIIDMFGSGEELEATKKLAKKLDVEDVVNFCGNKPNDKIISEMRNHELFIFTSDRNEGWGVVLNEAMANGCTVVASDEIGSVPFLIEDGVNGTCFKSCDIDSLVQKVIYLIEQPDERQKMVQNAYYTMQSVWSPENAAKSFLALISNSTAFLINTNTIYGPCSRA